MDAHGGAARGPLRVALGAGCRRSDAVVLGPSTLATLLAPSLRPRSRPSPSLILNLILRLSPSPGPSLSLRLRPIPSLILNLSPARA